MVAAVDIFPEMRRAWKAFVCAGIIDRELVRPEIAESWLRCAQGGDKRVSKNKRGGTAGR